MATDIYKVKKIGEDIYEIKTYRTMKDPNNNDIQAPVDIDSFITVADIQRKIDSLQVRIDVWQTKLNAVNALT